MGMRDKSRRVHVSFQCTRLALISRSSLAHDDPFATAFTCLVRTGDTR